MNLAHLSCMGMPQVLEAVMLVCFGVAWPCASLRMLRTGRPQSNGLCFTLVIFCGYLLGASSKLLEAVRGAELAPVFWLYAVNAISVAVNLGLQLHYGGRRSGCRVDALGTATKTLLLSQGPESNAGADDWLHSAAADLRRRESEQLPVSLKPTAVRCG